jgi:hypothetical protein
MKVLLILAATLVTALGGCMDTGVMGTPPMNSPLAGTAFLQELYGEGVQSAPAMSLPLKQNTDPC